MKRRNRDSVLTCHPTTHVDMPLTQGTWMHNPSLARKRKPLRTREMLATAGPLLTGARYRGNHRCDAMPPVSACRVRIAWPLLSNARFRRPRGKRLMGSLRTRTGESIPAVATTTERVIDRALLVSGRATDGIRLPLTAARDRGVATSPIAKMECRPSTSWTTRSSSSRTRMARMRSS